MKINDIRSKFLDYFNSNEHEIVQSSPLVPLNDPTLMFANSGMVQFKNVFTGLENRDYKRAVTAQKCIRAGGKHNDLENVGYTLRHHTFFEMLGNFSFGDYFKDEAIDYAWNFITKELSISKDKLYVTIFHNDEQAYTAWKKVSGFDDSKIIRINTNDNFWSMGETGPCGPCSEIFFDHGDGFKGKPPSEADETEDRFVEIWNLVFMQYEQVDTKTRIDLPKPSIDTGMGIERIAAVMQGTNNNYKIDSIQKLIDHSIDVTKQNKESFISSHRVIADHLRSSCFLVADGVLPSNEGRGYVLRRIMRRAMRHVHLLGYKDELMHLLAPTLITEMKGAYPELQRAEKLILETLKYEEQRFKELLDRGIKHLDNEAINMKSGDIFPGNSAFKLYDTYGFPIDLTQDILKAKSAETGKTMEEVTKVMVGAIPAGRFGEPEEIGSAIAFLCTPAADYISGINLLPLLLIISREVFISGLREFLAQGKKKITLPVSNLGKYKTAFQMLALILLILNPIISTSLIFIEVSGILLLWIASILSVLSGYQYYRSIFN